ncbi:MAG: glutaredoxin family protein [Dehalococcoidales bacterium]|nr:glutaredoxin family protein [Dehalococcoidales bacterium]
MALKHVPGKKVAKITLFALSTCVWCKKVKQLLNDLGVEYDFVDVDLLQGEEQENIVKTVERWNPRSSFPTMVINDDKCIIGFQENAIREALKTP